MRAKFYRKFGDWEVVNLFSEEQPTSQLFVDKYLALAESGTFSEEELWDRTVSQLESEGVDLTGKTSVPDKESDKPKINQLSFKDLFKEA